MATSVTQILSSVVSKTTKGTHTNLKFLSSFGAGCFKSGLSLLSQLCPDNTLVLWHLADSAPVASLFVHKKTSLSKTNNCFSFACR